MASACVHRGVNGALAQAASAAGRRTVPGALAAAPSASLHSGMPLAAPLAGVRRAMLGALAMVALTAAPAVALSPTPTTPPSVADGAALLKAEQRLVKSQRGDGGLPVAGLAAVQRVNLWGALGLAAASVNARQQATSANSRTLFGLLRTFAAGGELSDTADLALYLLAAHAVGFPAVRGEQDGAGAHDIVDDLLAAQLPGTSPDAGGFAAQPGAGSADPQSTAYAVLALLSLDPFDRSFATAAVDWLVGHQNGDGSWGPLPGAPGDVEATATVREALSAAGRDGSVAASRASSWLGTHQGIDGGWSRTGDGTTSDVPATAAVARSLLAQGVNPVDANNNAGQSPMSFLRSAQGLDGLVGRAPGVPADEPTQTTAIAMLAFGGTGLLFGPIAGGADTGGLPNQGPPAGLPSGPLLPTEAVTPAASAPAAPAPSAPAPAPSIQAPATPSSSSAHEGVRRVKARRGTGTRGNGLAGAGGSGAGAGGGAGRGVSATPSAPGRDGGGGGVSPGPVSAAAPSVAGTPVPPSSSRTGGTRTRTEDSAPRSVQGTLIGRQSATEGARGSSLATPGAAGARSGGRTTPWWAIALALTILAGIAAGVRLDRRHPEVAL
jgi:hypothetical protein